MYPDASVFQQNNLLCIKLKVFRLKVIFKKYTPLYGVSYTLGGRSGFYNLYGLGYRPTSNEQ